MIEYRKEIDCIDTQIIQLLKEREDVAKKVAVYKKEHNLPIFDAEREKKLLENRASQADDKEFIHDLFEIIMKRSKKVQQEAT